MSTRPRPGSTERSTPVEAVRPGGGQGTPSTIVVDKRRYSPHGNRLRPAAAISPRARGVIQCTSPTSEGLPRTGAGIRASRPMDSASWSLRLCGRFAAGSPTSRRAGARPNRYQQPCDENCGGSYVSSRRPVDLAEAEDRQSTDSRYLWKQVVTGGGGYARVAAERLDPGGRVIAVAGRFRARRRDALADELAALGRSPTLRRAPRAGSRRPTRTAQPHVPQFSDPAQSSMHW